MNTICYEAADPLGHGDITASVGVADSENGRGPFRLPVYLDTPGRRRPEVYQWLPLTSTVVQQQAACRATVEEEVARRSALGEQRVGYALADYAIRPGTKNQSATPRRTTGDEGIEP